jgi:hypothetical protein
MSRRISSAASRHPLANFKAPQQIQLQLTTASSLASDLSGGNPLVSAKLKSAIRALFTAVHSSLQVQPPPGLLDYITWRLEAISTELDTAAAQPDEASVAVASESVLVLVECALGLGPDLPEFCSLAFGELQKLTDALCRNPSPELVRSAQRSTLSAAKSHFDAFYRRPGVAIGSLFSSRMGSLSLATSDDLIADLRAFWDFAHEHQIMALTGEIGDLMNGVLETRTDDELQMSNVAGLYLVAVRHPDDHTADRLRGVFLTLLDRRIASLEDFRPKLLSSSDLIERVQILNSKTFDLIRAIGTAREAEFIRHGDDLFQKRDVEVSQNARRHLEALLREPTHDEVLSLAYEQSLSSSPV